jgi:hypothetical protein
MHAATLVDCDLTATIVALRQRPRAQELTRCGGVARCAVTATHSMCSAAPQQPVHAHTHHTPYVFIHMIYT